LRLGDRFVIAPYVAGWGWTAPEGGEWLPENFAYRSDTNDQWLSAEDIRTMIDSLPAD
jgi:UDP-N-acetylglucosamine 4,6-dehydratase